MAKNSVRDYSATNSSNTDIQSIDISEGCSPANINNAIREVMVDLKNVSTGAIALETPAADSLTVTGDLTVDTNTLKVDSANNRVGIGTSSPSQQLSIVDTNARMEVISSVGGTSVIDMGTTSDADAAGVRYASGTGAMSFRANGDERMRIDSNGVLSSTSAAANIANFTTAHASTSNIAFKYNTSTNLGYFGNGSGLLSAASATDFVMRSENDIVFATGGNNERVRLDSSHGNLMIGTNDSTYNSIGAPAALTSFNNGVRFGANFGASTTGSQYTVVFSNPNGQIGGVSLNGSATSYVTSSDYRLKTSVNYDWDATTRLKQLKPARFKWIADGDDAVEVDGFLAHEAATVCPESVTGTKDEVEVWKNGEELPDGVSVGDNKLDKDGNTIPVMQAIDQAKLVPLLCKTILELEARITALEAG